MATKQLAPIFVSLDVWDEVEDMTEVLRKMQQEGPEDLLQIGASLTQLACYTIPGMGPCRSSPVGQTGL
jgi:hypothetical protein